MQFQELIKLAKQSCQYRYKAKIAVLGNYATQGLVKALFASHKLKGIDADIYEAEFNQIQFEFLSPDSQLYVTDPEFVVLNYSALALNKVFNKLEDEEKTMYAESFVSNIAALMSSARRSGLLANYIVIGPELINGYVYGNYSSKIRTSFEYQLNKLRYLLSELSLETSDLSLIDINQRLMQLGEQKSRNWSMYINADMHYSLDVFSYLAIDVANRIAASKGQFNKCLILDLDNTMWGGIIGDDGMDKIQIGDLGIGKAFSNLQEWALLLKERGVILAICSKNTESIAKEPFENHLDMTLRLRDISVFVANWENKADNIRYIQKVLNIGFDSMVFIDDNPAEREVVRQNLPEVDVPELPNDPAEYVNFLKNLNLFETVSYSKTDAARTAMYQNESKRVKLSTTYTDINAYLSSLDMEVSISSFQEVDVARIAQLSQRSNQFNLRTIRFSEGEISEILMDEKYITYSIKLKDKFGDYGLISIVIVKLESNSKAFINTWIMSCRVLKRDVEKEVLNKIILNLKERGVELLIGEYIMTAKNKLVESHYPNLGFSEEKQSGRYFLRVNEFCKFATEIR